MKDEDCYVYSIFDDKTKEWLPKKRVLNSKVLELIKSIREFIKKNNMPFCVFPISNGRICVRNSLEIFEAKERILYKSILKSANLRRITNPIWDPDALCYYFEENDCDDVDITFDTYKIKTAFERYTKRYAERYAEENSEVNEELRWRDDFLL